MSAPRSQSELAACIKSCRGAIVTVGVLTALINVLSLTGSLFMLSVYDHAIPSQSTATLLGLVVFAAVMYVFYGLLEALRGQVLIRVGSTMSESLAGRVYRSVVAISLRGRREEGAVPLRDLDTIRSFISGAGPAALFDLPWMPFYLLICFLFHTYIGLAAVAGCIVMIVLTMMSERMTKQQQRFATELGEKRHASLESARRNAEALQAMGMVRSTSDLWLQINQDYLKRVVRLADVASSLGSVSKVTRMAIQSGVLAVGGYLVIKQEATGGIMIASSILSARALAPVDTVIANWRNFVQFRQSWGRLNAILGKNPSDKSMLLLHAPNRMLSVEGLALAPPGVNRAVLQGVEFSLASGSGLGVIGPSASGKSSLARALVGLWPPARGTIRLDGAALDQWDPVQLGRHIGYLPQDVELLEGTIADNISRFDAERTSEQVIAAAESAGVHELILRLPEGYQTHISENGSSLSTGQRQRIGLARALYGEPFLVVLDEPNSNLDAAGEEALTKAIIGVRQRGGIVVVIAHRPSAVAGVDHILMLADGMVRAFGEKEAVFKRLSRGAGEPVPGPSLVRESPGARS